MREKTVTLLGFIAERLLDLGSCASNVVEQGCLPQECGGSLVRGLLGRDPTGTPWIPTVLPR